MNQDFFEFSMNSSTTISSYVLHVDASKALLFCRYLFSWTLYGSIGENGIAPTSPDDPSWNVIDAQFNVDFSMPPTLNPGHFTYNVVKHDTVAYRYFGFVGVIVPLFSPSLQPYQFINPVTGVDFCS